MNSEIIKQELVEDRNCETINASLIRNPFDVQIKQEIIGMEEEKHENASYSSTELQVNSHISEQHDGSDKPKEKENTRNCIIRKGSHDNDLDAMHDCPFLSIVRNSNSGMHIGPYTEHVGRSPLAVFLQSHTTLLEGLPRPSGPQSKYWPDDGCRFNVQRLATFPNN